MFAGLSRWGKKTLSKLLPRRREPPEPEVVRRHYREVLGRDPGPQDLAHWAGQLQSEAFSADDLRDLLRAVKQLESDTYCVLPWINLWVGNDGWVRPCCMFDGGMAAPDGSSLSAARHSLDEIWHSDFLRGVRGDLVEGKYVPGCKPCYQVEATGSGSFRTNANRAFLQELLADPRKARAILEESRLPPRPPHLHLDAGHLCNLKCRMCDGLSSSRIAKDAVHDSWAGELGRSFGQSSGEMVLRRDMIPNLLRHPERIELLDLQGGETLLIKEVGEILQHLIDAGVAQNIAINAVTNATTTNSAWLKLAGQFKHLHLTVSIDGFGKFYEYIRYPAKWDMLLRNIQILKTLPRTTVGANVTVQNYNVLSLVELFRCLDGLGLAFSVFPLTSPPWLRATTMPPRARQLAAQRLHHYAADGCRPQHREVVLGLAHGLESAGEAHDLKLLHDFMLFTNDLDASRGQSFAQTHEELLGLIRETGFAWTTETRYAGRPGPLSLPVLGTLAGPHYQSPDHAGMGAVSPLPHGRGSD